MPDIFSEEQYSYNMSRIRGSNTNPELILRNRLQAQGMPSRLHRRNLPGVQTWCFKSTG